MSPDFQQTDILHLTLGMGKREEDDKVDEERRGTNATKDQELQLIDFEREWEEFVKRSAAF